MISPRILHALLLGGFACASVAADPRSADWFYNPFSADSAHHRPIGTGAAPRSRETLLEAALRAGESVWAAAQDPARHDIRMGTTLTYALALCEAGVQPGRLEKLFDVARQLQDRNPQSPTYGSFRWLWNDTNVKDANAIEFSMQPAAVLWLKHRDTMPAAARRILHDILEPAAVIASVRHRVSDGYTNIALMSASNLVMLGEGLNRPDVADEGYRRLQAAFDLTRRTGIREYVSPDYYGVDLDALQLAATFAQRPAGRRLAQSLVELFWTDVAAHFWWPVRRLAGAHGRNYDYLHSLGGLDRQLWAAGWIDGEASDSASIVFPAVGRWELPAELVAMSRAKLPRLVRQMWGGALPGPATPGAPAALTTSSGGVWAAATHWLGSDVSLGIGGKNYGPIDIPLAVDFPGPRDSVRCYFMPDGRGDAYGKSKIPWRGHPKAVHLQPFFAAVQETKDALALVVYREADIPSECISLESHFVMPRAVDAIYAGEQQIEFVTGRPRTISLSSDTPVFLRRGTAAVGVRVPAARTLTGEPAPIALVWDDNDWGAVRLTVDHQLTGAARTTSAAAAFQVRVGSELDDAAFGEFRRAFAAAKCEITSAADQIAVRSPAAKSPLAISAAAPWTQPSLLEPVAPRAVLEIDGIDVGRRILDSAR